MLALLLYERLHYAPDLDQLRADETNNNVFSHDFVERQLAEAVAEVAPRACACADIRGKRLEAAFRGRSARQGNQPVLVLKEFR